jgi:RPA family protein
MSSAPGNREVAHRVFAAEFDAADLEHSESDEERAPNYVITPTGARVNRAFVVGVLTEVEQVGEEVLRARVVDPTGAFVVYAGQYQPEELAFLEDAEPPAFVAVTGKARTFSPDDADVIYTSLRPESINAVDAETRDRWTVRAAEHTLARVATASAALASGLSGDALAEGLDAAGAPPGVAAGVPIALDHYGTTEHYLSGVAETATEALRLVAGEVDAVEIGERPPDAAGDGVVDRERIAAATDLSVVDADAIEGAASTADPEAEPGIETTDDAEAESAGEAKPDTETETGSEADPESEVASESTAEPKADPEPSGSSGPEDAEEVDAGEGAGAVEAGEDVGADDPSEDVGADDPGEDDGAAEAGDAATDGVPDADVTGTGESDDSVEEVPDEVIDEEERERIEEEYGTDFQTGTEVEEPGEAGIEPEAGPIGAEGDEETATDDGTEAEGETATEESAASTDATGDDLGDFDGGSDYDVEETGDESDGGSDDDSAADTDETPSSDEEPAAEPEPADSDDDGSDGDDNAESADDVDLTEAALSAMEDLDDGTGADREAVIETVVEQYGAAEGDVEDAIQDALMNGQCYEPGDGKLSAI